MDEDANTIEMTIEKEFTVDADSYSLLNLTMAMGVAASTVTSIMNPLGVITYRSIKDVKDCSTLHYSNKSILKTLMQKNPGRTPECGNCLKSTNSFLVGKEIFLNEGGFSVLWRGIGWNMSLQLSKNLIFIYVYEKGIII